MGGGVTALHVEAVCGGLDRVSPGRGGLGREARGRGGLSWEAGGGGRLGREARCRVAIAWVRWLGRDWAAGGSQHQLLT